MYNGNWDVFPRQTSVYQMLQAPSIASQTAMKMTEQRRRAREEKDKEVEGAAAVSFHSFTEFSVNIGRACKAFRSISAN